MGKGHQLSQLTPGESRLVLIFGVKTDTAKGKLYKNSFVKYDFF